MAYVTSLTADRMLEIEQKSVTSGHIDAFGNLILRTHGGSEFNAGKATGGAGVGVSSVNHFYLQLPKGSSAPAAPVILDPPEDSPWKDVEPQYEPNTVVYITTRVVYSNGSFQYTRPSVSSNYAAVDSVATNISEIYELADQAEARAESAVSEAAAALADAKLAKERAEAAISESSQLKRDIQALQDEIDNLSDGAGNLLFNGDFETLDDSGVPEGWSLPNSSNRFYPDGASRSGTKCLRQVGMTSTYETAQAAKVAITSGRFYSVEVQVKAEVISPQQAVGIRARLRSTAGAVVDTRDISGDATSLSVEDWSKISGFFEVTDQDAAELEISLYTSGGADGIYLFDDVVVRDVTDIVEAQEKANEALQKAIEAKEAADLAVAGILEAQAKADAALSKATTADGRYTVSTVAPTTNDGNDKPEGAIWEVRDGGVSNGRYLWSGSDWEPLAAGTNFIAENAIGSAQIADAAIGTAEIADLAVTNGKLGSVSIGKLEVLNGAKFNAAVMNALITDQAFINRLLAERAIISGAENRIPNGDLGLGTTVPWKDVTLDATDKPAPYKYSMAGPRSSTASQFFNGDDSWIDVTPGGVYRFECWARADLPNSVFYLELRDQDGNHAVAKGEALGDNSVRSTVGSFLMNQVNLPTQWTRYGALVTLRDTSTRVRIGAAHWNHPAGTEKAAIQKLAGLSLRPMVGSDLIVNGSVMIGSLAPEVMDTVESSISEVQQSTSEYIDSTHQEALSSIDSVSGAVQALANEVTERNLNYDLYIQLDGSGILLGQRDSPFKVKITNTEMSFLQDGLKIAYVSNSKLYITDVEVKNNLAMGTPDSGFFDFIPRANGNLSFVYRRN